MSEQVSGDDFEARKQSCVGRILRFLFRVCDTFIFTSLCLASVSATLRFDRYAIGMPFTYSPRLFWLIVAACLAIAYFCLRRFKRLAIIALLSVLLCYDATWGIAKRRYSPGPTLTLLSFNTHYASGEDIEKLCSKHEVDILCLQENLPAMGPRREFLQALPKYQFFAAHAVELGGYKREKYSCLIGVRRSLLEQPTNVEIETAITNYRTFAVKVNLRNGSLWLINVHTTKPVTLLRNDIKLSLKDTLLKTERHREEHSRLKEWLVRHTDEATPVVIAGDFNAPGNSQNLRLPGLVNAQRVCGRGLHMTFPARFPVFGIDHVLGNSAVQFQSCEILDTELSDHRAMLVRFGFRP